VGAKMISALASIFGLENEENRSEEEVKKMMSQIVDPAGTFYRFSLPKSLLIRKWNDKK
jgi:F420-non-reducing hydrogenase small subunit